MKSCIAAITLNWIIDHYLLKKRGGKQFNPRALSSTRDHTPSDLIHSDRLEKLPIFLLSDHVARWWRHKYTGPSQGHSPARSKECTTSCMILAFSDTHCPSESHKARIWFLYLQTIVAWWKNFVFLSPSWIHWALDFYLQKISCCLRRKWCSEIW